MNTSAALAPEACDEKDRLLADYRESVRLYGVAVDDLTEARPRVSKDAYLRLAMRAETARLTTETARLALERHVFDHGC